MCLTFLIELQCKKTVVFTAAHQLKQLQ